MIESSPQTIASRVGMLRNHPNNKNKTILLVEGKSDENMHRTYKHPACHLEPCGGKPNVLDALKIIRDRKNVDPETYGGVLTSLDNDLDPFLGLQQVHPDVHYTDTSDLETMMLKSAAFDKLLCHYGLSEKQIQLLRSCLAQSALPLGCLRLINHRNNYRLKFSDLKRSDFTTFVNVQKIEINIEKMVYSVIKQSNVILPPFDLVQQIHNALKQNYDPWLVCNGHDMMEILACVLSDWCNIAVSRRYDADYCRDLPSQDCLEKRLALAYEFFDFVESNLYKSLRKWEGENLQYNGLC